MDDEHRAELEADLNALSPDYWWVIHDGQKVFVFVDHDIDAWWRRRPDDPEV